MLLIESSKIIVPQFQKMNSRSHIRGIQYEPGKYIMCFYNKLLKRNHWLKPWIKIS